MNFDEESSDDHREEWLRLSLYNVEESVATETDDHSENQPVLGDGKMYSCNFCLRKFCSSQALGGHQNAHKTERRQLKRYRQSQSQAGTMMYHPGIPFMGSPTSGMGLQVHGVAHLPIAGRSAENLAARFSTPGMPAMFHEAVNAFWPGSLRAAGSDAPKELDLSLRL